MSQAYYQPRSQGLFSLPILVVGTETLVAAGHVTWVSVPTNTGGREERPWERGWETSLKDSARSTKKPKYGQIRSESKLFCAPFRRYQTFPSSWGINPKHNKERRAVIVCPQLHFTQEVVKCTIAKKNRVQLLIRVWVQQHGTS